MKKRWSHRKPTSPPLHHPRPTPPGVPEDDEDDLWVGPHVLVHPWSSPPRLVLGCGFPTSEDGSETELEHVVPSWSSLRNSTGLETTPRPPRHRTPLTVCPSTYPGLRPGTTIGVGGGDVYAVFRSTVSST